MMCRLCHGEAVFQHLKAEDFTMGDATVYTIAKSVLMHVSEPARRSAEA